MSILSELNEIIEKLKIPVETGVFLDTPPAKYIVLTPMNDNFEEYSDNKPNAEVNEVRISLFHFGNYIDTKDALTKVLLDADFTITDRLYVGFDKDTGYHNYAIDVAKEYSLEKEDE